jgi:hypothetical protein
MTQITSYRELVSALVYRRHAMKLSQEVLSERAGLADRFASKVECHTKRLGPISMPCILGALRVELIAEACDFIGPPAPSPPPAVEDEQPTIETCQEIAA